ncbi:probable rRNA-processing protein EBP2 homolog [Rutidosis leptorrhynchoides]|uniref:probable rRNA-processing protein EBP2 homolog n=1 Tax=Rutidosis leptorrhynchoides TaxID=125765 RepID=UPI003A99FAAA
MAFPTGTQESIKFPRPLLSPSPPQIPNYAPDESSSQQNSETLILVCLIVLVFLALVDATVDRCMARIHLQAQEGDDLESEEIEATAAFIVSDLNYLSEHPWIMEIMENSLQELMEDRREQRLRALEEILPYVEYKKVVFVHGWKIISLVRFVGIGVMWIRRSQVHSMVKRKQVSNHEDLMKDDEMDDLIQDNDFESESESEEDEEGQDIKLSEPSKTAIFNREEILEKLKDISWPENVGWIHKLSIDINQEKEVDVNDDLARELAFYTQALEGTREAFEKLESMGLPFLRPPDYYAEMVKTDAHMVKVKGRLLSEKKKIEEAEERRKARESKKLAKEVQAQKNKQRTKQKKEEIENVKKWRKQRQQSGFAGGKDGADVPLPFDDDNEGSFRKSKKLKQGVAPGDRSGGKGSRVMGKGKGKKSREFKNSKFGFGGRKGMKKQNTAETTNDMRGFNQRSFGGNKKKN